MHQLCLQKSVSEQVNYYSRFEWLYGAKSFLIANFWTHERRRCLYFWQTKPVIPSLFFGHYRFPLSLSLSRPPFGLLHILHICISFRKLVAMQSCFSATGVCSYLCCYCSPLPCSSFCGRSRCIVVWCICWAAGIRSCKVKLAVVVVVVVEDLFSSLHHQPSPVPPHPAQSQRERNRFGCNNTHSNMVFFCDRLTWTCFHLIKSGFIECLLSLTLSLPHSRLVSRLWPYPIVISSSSTRPVPAKPLLKWIDEGKVNLISGQIYAHFLLLSQHNQFWWPVCVRLAASKRMDNIWIHMYVCILALSSGALKHSTSPFSMGAHSSGTFLVAWFQFGYPVSLVF